MTTTSSSFILDPSTFKKLQPLEYQRRFLSEQVRSDGRPLTGYRDISIKTGCISSADGSSIVKLGNTTVVCGIKAELASPRPLRPRDGYIVPNIDLPPVCSGKYRAGPPGEQTQSLSAMLNDVVTKCRIIDLESLCVKEGKYVWVLYVDVVCLEDDGSVFDAAMIGMISALKQVELVDVDVADDGVVEMGSGEKRRLQVRGLYSVGYVEVGKHALVDGNVDEEGVSGGWLKVVVDGEGNEVGVIGVNMDRVEGSGERGRFLEKTLKSSLE